MMMRKHATIGNYKAVPVSFLPQLAGQLSDGLLACQYSALNQVQRVLACME